MQEMAYFYDIVALLISIGMFVFLFNCIIRRRILIFVCAGFAILLFGCIVYLICGKSGICDNSGTHPLAQAINQTLSSFWPSRGGYDRPYRDSWCYWFFHLLAIMYVGVVLVAILGKSLCNWLLARCRLFMHKEETNVFWDFCDEARWVASTIKDKSSVVFALREGSRVLVGDTTVAVSNLLKDGFRWVYASPGRTKWLSSADRHFFLGANGHENVSGARELVESYHGKSPIKVFVRISAMADDDVLYSWADMLNKDKGGRVEIIVVREESIVSTMFLQTHPMLDCPGIKRFPDAPKGFVAGRFRTLVIGFGAQGERLLADSVCDAQFVDESNRQIPMEFVVVDKDESSFGWFRANCVEACRRYGIRFEKMEAGAEAFWTWLKGDAAFNRIIVCTKDDRENISLAHDISRLYKLRHWKLWRDSNKAGRTIVYARVRNALISQYVSETYGPDKAPFLPFGSMKEIYNAKFLLENKWWRAGIWVNALYRNPNEEDEKKAADNWLGASSFDRESSFASAFHQRNLLRLIGYEIVNASAVNDENNTAVWNAASEEERLHQDTFSRIEHLRWMAFHFVRGIESWRPPVEELRALVHSDDGSKQQAKPNMLLKTSERHVHAALRDFDDLPEVDTLFDMVNRENNQELHGRLQDYDKALTYGFKALKKADMGICKAKT